MSRTKINKPIAKSSVRKRLWAALELGPHDGTAYREDGPDGDVIVLNLRPSALRRIEPIENWEGFVVDVRPLTAGYANAATTDNR